MVEGFLSPGALPVEYEDLFRLHISEHHFRVEVVHAEYQGVGDDLGIHPLQVLYVNCDPPQPTEEVSFQEDDLLTVGQQFRMEGVVAHH